MKGGRLGAFKLFGEFQALALIIRRNPRPVQGFGALLHTLVNQPSHDLRMLQHKGRLVAAHF